ncbi:MAG: transporter substrate-binding domain-containing protein, partial [Synergistaceae bacterium]|nr:transporter substrate-binding domain-containing protein [Synergistaceae bacterium]
AKIQAAWDKWTGADESVKTLIKQDWPGKNGTVTAAVCDTLEPMSYLSSQGEAAGFDIEIILLIAKELDVHVKFINMDLAAVQAYVTSGKADLGAGSIIVSPERRQSMNFIEHYPAEFVLGVRAKAEVKAEVKAEAQAEAEVKAEAQAEAQAESTFWDEIKASFNKTFIREGRY